MAGVQRTTPNAKNKALSQTQSVPDISTAIDMSEQVTSRHKRPRSEHSPENVSVSNQPNLNDFLATWKKDQDTRVSKMLEEQSTLMAKLVADTREIKAQNTKIQESNSEIRKTSAQIEQSMSFMNTKFEELKKEVEGLKKERQDQRSYIEALEKKITDLQYKSRSSCIEVRNIPQPEKESTISLVNTVCKIGQLVGVPISESEIRDVYRLPGKSTPTPISRPIMAEFTRVQTKQNLLSAIRLYNKDKHPKEEKLNTEIIGIPGKRLPVFVAEQIPSSSKRLFYLARQFANNNHYSFCWISNGNIFLRKKVGEKQLLIQSEKCLQNLSNTNI